MKFFMPYIGAHVQLLCEEQSSKGVHAIIVLDGGKHWALLVDNDDHDGVSATNGFEAYAGAAAQSCNKTVADFVWFERDSIGRFDRWHLNGTGVAFAAIHAKGCKPSSQEAFLACLDALGLRYSGSDFRSAYSRVVEMA